MDEFKKIKTEQQDRSTMYNTIRQMLKDIEDK